jgi:TLC domain
MQAIWTVTCFIHRFQMERIKDYFMMYLHHIVTIGLIVGSYYMRYVRIGLLVLLVHDASDIGVDMLKIFNYMKLRDARSYFMVEVCGQSVVHVTCGVDVPCPNSFADRVFLEFGPVDLLAPVVLPVLRHLRCVLRRGRDGVRRKVHLQRRCWALFVVSHHQLAGNAGLGSIHGTLQLNVDGGWRGLVTLPLAAVRSCC